MNNDNLLHASRAEQRRQRLLDAERELAAEEADALTLTEEQRQTLLRPFAAVKAEFADLDGLRWTQTALLRRQPSHRRPPAPVYPDSDPNTSAPTTAPTNAFAVLTNADLATFAPDDTIRVPPQPPRNRPRFPSPLIRGTTSLPSTSNSDQLNHHHHQRPPTGHRDGTRTRSPVKGLFSHDPDADDAEWTPRQVYMEDMDPMTGYSEGDESILRPPPPGLTQAPMCNSTAAESSARRTHAATLLESSAEPFSSSLLDPPPPQVSSRSLSAYYSSASKSTSTSKSTSHPSQSTRSTNDLTLRPLSRTPSTSTSTLTILTSSSPNFPSSSHHLPRRQTSKHGVPRPTRHAPSPPSSTHTNGDADEADDEGFSSLLNPPSPSSASLFDPPPRSSSLLAQKPRPISRSASFYLPSTTTPALSASPRTPHSHPNAHHHPNHTTAPQDPQFTASPRANQPSPRARLASLLAHTPSPSLSPAASSAPPPLLRARSSSASASAHPTPPGHSTRPIRPPGLRGWSADGPSVHVQPVQVQIHGNGTGGSGNGYTSEDDAEEWDAEETPRASPVETPGGSPSRGWIRGFA